MYSLKFRELLRKYQKERNIVLTEDQFAALVYTFPSVLVAQADGRIDRAERDFMQELPEVLTGSVLDGEMVTAIHTPMTEEYFKEVEYLIANLHRWERPFLEALKEQLHNSLNERNAIFQMMWRTADSSDDISAEERQRIEYISRTLEL